MWPRGGKRWRSMIPFFQAFWLSAAVTILSRPFTLYSLGDPLPENALHLSLILGATLGLFRPRKRPENGTARMGLILLAVAAMGLASVLCLPDWSNLSKRPWHLGGAAAGLLLVAWTQILLSKEDLLAFARERPPAFLFHVREVKKRKRKASAT